MSEPNAMDGLMTAQRYENEIEHGLIEAFGGLEALWFDDWWFDTYDLSVELAGSKPGSEPTPEQLAALLALGIRSAFVSYTDGTARQWYYRDGAWGNGQCSARDTDRGKVLLLRQADRENATLRDRLAQAEQMLQKCIPLLCDHCASDDADRNAFDENGEHEVESKHGWTREKCKALGLHAALAEPPQVQPPSPCYGDERCTEDHGSAWCQSKAAQARRSEAQPPASTPTQAKSLKECAAEMADYTLGFLSKLPPEERDARIHAFMEATDALRPVESGSTPVPGGSK